VIPPETPPPPPPAPPAYPYAPPQAQAPVLLTPQDVNSKKLAAGICAILLGWLGVHKFILGMTGPGLILLLSGLLTCGLASAVTALIGLVEGIVYLTKTDEEFYRIYLVQKREWF
jgi:TM2 domain-containing membrane protein YozV